MRMTPAPRLLAHLLPRIPRNICSHPWSHVVIGMWHKYPNPHCSHVVTIDVVDRSVNPETGVIRTERILGCKQKAPTWIVKVSRLSVSFVVPSLVMAVADEYPVP